MAKGPLPNAGSLTKRRDVQGSAMAMVVATEQAAKSAEAAGILRGNLVADDPNSPPGKPFVVMPFRADRSWDGSDGQHLGAAGRAVEHSSLAIGGLSPGSLRQQTAHRLQSGLHALPGQAGMEGVAEPEPKRQVVTQGLLAKTPRRRGSDLVSV